MIYSGNALYIFSFQEVHQYEKIDQKYRYPFGSGYVRRSAFRLRHSRNNRAGTIGRQARYGYTTQGLVGEFDGIDVAVAKNIAEDAGMELEIVDMEFDGLIAAVSTGKIDMAVAGMTVTDERKEHVDFSDTYYAATQVIVVSGDNTDITCAEDLKNNKKVGVVLSYTGDQIVTDTLKVDEANIQRANRAIDIVQDVKNGKLDAVVMDSYTGIALAQKLGLKIVEDPAVFDTEEYAIAVQKGNTELLEKINSTLARMKDAGEIDALTEKYGDVQTDDV